MLALVEAAIAFAVRGWTGPLVALAAVALTALVARLGRRMLPFVLATIPLVASILLVNTFLFPGATDVMVRIGPLAPTWTGLDGRAPGDPARRGIRPVGGGVLTHHAGRRPA